MANPNVQPIYPKHIIDWEAQLTDQVTPRKISTETPVLLGTADENGALIHCIEVQPLGDNVGTVLRIYTKKEGAAVYRLKRELTLPATSGSNNATALAVVQMALPPILPSGNTGLRLEPGTSLYCSLGTLVATGVNVTVQGGDY